MEILLNLLDSYDQVGETTTEQQEIITWMEQLRECDTNQDFVCLFEENFTTVEQLNEDLDENGCTRVEI